MEKYNVGDIVKLKMLQGDDHYYMVSRVFDHIKREGRRFKAINYDMILIYPIKDNVTKENMIHEELHLVAEFGSSDYKVLINYIGNERSLRKLRPISVEVEDIIFIAKYNKYKKEGKANKETDEKLFSISKINEIMKDTTNEKQIELYVEKMNTHLDFLFEAINEDDEEKIEISKIKLKEIRKVLMELEYFPLAKRR